MYAACIRLRIDSIEHRMCAGKCISPQFQLLVACPLANFHLSGAHVHLPDHEHGQPPNLQLLRNGAGGTEQLDAQTLVS